jgi:hypothetical protein
VEHVKSVENMMKDEHAYFRSDVIHIILDFRFVWSDVATATGDSVTCLIRTGEHSVEYEGVGFAWSQSTIFKADQAMQRYFTGLGLFAGHVRNEERSKECRIGSSL